MALSGIGVAYGENDGSNFIRTTTFLSGSTTPAGGRVATVYYDGMGREALSVTGVSDDPENMIAVRSDYDERGNLSKKWLPVPGNETCLNRRVYESRAKTLYGTDEIPYTTYGYEETGRNRLVSEAGPGLLWKIRAVRTYFHRNEDPNNGSIALHRCKLLLVNKTDGRISVSGYYKPGTLRITETIDEDSIRTLVFENRSGNVVMRRIIGRDGQFADTRFVYDIYGDLRYVISPEGTRQLPASGNVNKKILDDYAQCYKYDFRHRCISEKIPGCGATEYVYDKFGNIIMSADAKPRRP